MTQRSCLLRVIAIPICVLSSVALSGSQSATGNIVVWKVGSPHRGDTPAAAVPLALQREWISRGVNVAVEAFPAAGFAARFLEAATRNAAPDVIVFDNLGVMEGITTPLGTFEGIGKDPAIRRDFIQVTGSFDALLGPTRGWTFLFAPSPNHNAARSLAERVPVCGADQGSGGLDELRGVETQLARAYLEGDIVGMQTLADPERLSPVARDGATVKAAEVQTCSIAGNQKLAFVLLKASYTSDATIGQTSVLLVLRKPASRWQLLVAARDPVSTDGFMKDARSMTSLLASDRGVFTSPVPAALLAPADGEFPRPDSGQRFGAFRWQSSASSEVVAEIVEFTYPNDARLFLTRPSGPESHSEVSAGQLWTTKSDWRWRVWSITGAGDVSFSDVRTFPH
jgi:hypothetical protein